MTSVKNADPKVMSMVTVMKNTVGPLSTTKKVVERGELRAEWRKTYWNPFYGQATAAPS